MTDIRVGDDDGALWLFSGENEEGQPLRVVDGPCPVFVAGNAQYFIPFLFGVCPDQATRTALYEYLKKSLLLYAIQALEGEEWSKAECLISALAEAEALRVLKYKNK